MGRLIKFELYKMSRRVSFYVCLGVVLFISLISIASSYLILVETVRELGLSGEAVKAMMPGVSDFLISCVGSANFTTLIGISIILMVCEDYTGKTIKNVYSHGFSRSQVYFAKLIVGLIAVTVAFIVTLVFNFVVAYAFFGKLGEDFNITAYVAQYVAVVCMYAFTSAVAFSTKKVGSSILILIFTAVILELFVTILYAILDLYNVEIQLYDLEKFVFTLYLGGVSSNTETWDIATVLIGSLCYGAAFVGLGWLTNRKHEM